MICPACLLSMDYHWSTSQPDRNLVGQGVVYEKCGGCGLVGRSPLPDENELRAYYEKSWQFSEPRPDRCFLAAAEFISQGAHSWTSGTAIDVGSKGGGLLERVGRLMPLRSITTLDAAPVAPGVERAWLGSGYQSAEKYDLVVATHVLEHVVRPDRFLHDVDHLLSGGGYLYLEVPSQEIGYVDVSACDDVNPNHLWHFSLQALMELASRAGLEVTAARADRLAPGWPCNRLLARKVVSDGFLDTVRAEERAYELAAGRIACEWQAGDALYGASYSCWRLFDRLESRPVYDLHKRGLIRGSKILHPSLMEADGVKRVWLTPRFWNSQKEIGGWLSVHHPTIAVMSPYLGLLEA